MGFSSDPKDAEVRAKGTLDRTLTVNAGLTANFHSSKPPTLAQIEFLADALAIARRAVDAAINTITGLIAATTATVEMDAAVYASLVFHYHLPPLADRKDWSAWGPDLKTILEFFTADRQHLAGTVVVGDSYRLVLKREYAIVKDPTLQKRITGSGRASEGFVNLKKSAWATIDANPKLFDDWINGYHKFPATEWGNIKVDFGKLCQVTRLQVAGTLIHETTHKMKNAVDHCYASSPGPYKTLTKAQALDNADSHAFAAVCLYKKFLIESDSAMTQLNLAKTIDAQI